MQLLKHFLRIERCVLSSKITKLAVHKPIMFTNLPGGGYVTPNGNVVLPDAGHGVISPNGNMTVLSGQPGPGQNAPAK